MSSTCYFTHFFKVDKYYFTHFCPTCCVIPCTCLHLFLLHIPYSIILPKYLLSLAFLPIKQWFGASASKSSALSMLAVIGQLFPIFSTSLKTVIIWKSVSILSLTMLRKDIFNTLTNLFHELLICGELEGLHFHTISYLSVNFVIFIWLRLLYSNFSSLTAPLKFDPQPDLIVLCLPLLLINLLSTLIKESVSILSTSSKCIAIVTIHTNKQPHLFNLDQCCLMNIGPK